MRRFYLGAYKKYVHFETVKEKFGEKNCCNLCQRSINSGLQLGGGRAYTPALAIFI
jgi:hypothetical protein